MFGSDIVKGQQKARPSAWLSSPIAIVIYALLLPSVQSQIFGWVSRLLYEFNPWDGAWSGGDTVINILYQCCDILVQALALGAVLLLANLLLGNRRLFPKPVRYGWLWVLGAAFIIQMVELLPATAMDRLNLYQNPTAVSIMPYLSLLPHIAQALAIILLSKRLLCSGEAQQENKIAWNRVSCSLLAIAIILPAAFHLTNSLVADRQRLAGLPSFRAYGWGYQTWQIIDALGSLLLVLLAYALAGGRLRSMIPAFPHKEAQALPPLEMTTEAENGQRALKQLLYIWIGTLVWQRLISIFFDTGSLALDTFVFALCLSVFLYYGRSWARGLWFAQTGFSCVSPLLLAVMLFDGWYGAEGVPALAATLPTAVVNLLVTWRLLHKGGSIQSYMLYCMISPPTGTQRKWEHRVPITAVTILAIEIIYIGIYFLLRTSLNR